MKKIISSSLFISLLFITNACEKNKNISDPIKTKSGNSEILLITKNKGRYPSEVKLFEDQVFSERLKKILGKNYEETINFFNVETPIVSENEVYKINGCKQNDCSGYFISIYYDSKKDNLNIFIDTNNNTKEFLEKGKINISESLKVK